MAQRSVACWAIRTRRRNRRRGLTLLELIIATSLLAMVLTTVSVVMRTGRAAWEAHEGDFTRLAAAHATLRHIVRETRQAEAVVTISDPTNNSGQLSLQMPDGNVLVWQHDASGNLVNYGQTTADSLLAEQITQLNFQGFRADGITATTAVDEIQCLRISVTVMLPREGNPSRTVSSWAWIRSW